MPRLSILIPFAGDVEPFESTLASVLQNRPDNCEIIVAHAGRYTDPYELADEVSFVTGPSDASCVQLLNVALGSAQADVVHVLAGGAEVVEGWTAAPLAQFADSDIGSVSPLVISANDAARIAARGVNYGIGGTRKVSGASARLTEKSLKKVAVLGPTLAAGFYRRDPLLALGGFDAALGSELADIDAALSLQYLGYDCVFEPLSRIQFREALTTKLATFRGGLRAERLFWRNRIQRGGLLATILHPMTVLLQAAWSIPKWGSVSQLVGRAIGCVEFGTARRYQEKLQAAAATLDEESSQTLLMTPKLAAAQNPATPARRAA